MSYPYPYPYPLPLPLPTPTPIPLPLHLTRYGGTHELRASHPQPRGPRCPPRLIYFITLAQLYFKAVAGSQGPKPEAQIFPDPAVSIEFQSSLSCRPLYSYQRYHSPRIYRENVHNMTAAGSCHSMYYPAAGMHKEYYEVAMYADNIVYDTSCCRQYGGAQDRE